MKKIITLLLCLCVVLGLVACGETEATYKLGMGVVVNFDESKNQINATVATVVLDANGKIVSCRIDVAQNTVAFEDGEVNTDKVYETKMELGDRYGMATSEWSSDNDEDGRILEWDVQTKAFENYVVGKTVAGVRAIGISDTPVHDHYITTDTELLKAGCTIQIGDFQEAVIKACEDKHGMSFKTSDTSFKLGVAATSFDDGSADGTIKVYTDFAASVVGANNKILASLNDAIQPTMSYEGEAVTETSYKGTKRELEVEYGMSTSEWSSDNDGDTRILEWFEQSKIFSEYVVGKTGTQVANLATQIYTNSKGEDYHIPADNELLSAGCTIQITAIKAVVAKSVTNAR